LILHSYHPGLEWTRGVHAGIEQSFAQDELTVELDDEYLTSPVGFRAGSGRAINNFTPISPTRSNTDYELIIGLGQ
jgi:hypothetical protein